MSGESPSARAGLTHFRFAQQVDGLTVYGTYVKAAVNDRGELVHLIENLAASAGGVRPAAVGAGDALAAALDTVHPGRGRGLAESTTADNTVTFAGDSFFHREPTVTRVAIAMKIGALQEGYLVETWSDDDNLLHHTLVGGNGRVLGVQLRTANDSYYGYSVDPGVSSQSVMPGPGWGNAESPDGWLAPADQNRINMSGNNVHAYLDTDDNDLADGGGTIVEVIDLDTDGNFLTAADLSQDPSDAANQEVSVQNLFYLSNEIHDELYRHGFTESAGNFQILNFGNGGNGSDPVNAEAQDGGGSNNANFATPDDGSSPRMQTYLWTQSTPRRDSALDSDIVWHEYVHGLTWRMIDNMSGSMSGAVGEGMSDAFATLINGDDVVGEYAYNNPIGIRSAPYTDYLRTYGDFTGSSVHFNGEVFAATIWRLWEIYQREGIDLDTLLDDLVDGMNYTAPGPAFQDMRDGLLGSVDGSGRECLVWEAFAAFGVGEGVATSIKGGGPSGGKVTVTESFELPTVPLDCSGAVVAVKDSYTVAEGEDLVVVDPAQGLLANDHDAGLNVEVVQDPDFGSVTCDPDGTFTYSPGPDFSGSDSFVYKAKVGSMYSNATKVTIGSGGSKKKGGGNGDSGDKPCKGKKCNPVF